MQTADTNRAMAHFLLNKTLNYFCWKGFKKRSSADGVLCQIPEIYRSISTKQLWVFICYGLRSSGTIQSRIFKLLCEHICPLHFCQKLIQPFIYPLIMSDILDRCRETIMFSTRKKKVTSIKALTLFVAMKRGQFYTLLSITIISDGLKGVDNRINLNAGI